LLDYIKLKKSFGEERVMLLNEKDTAGWVALYEEEALVPKGLKTFIYLQQKDEPLDFSAVIEWFKPQKFYVNRIERFNVIFDIAGTYHITIERVNPPEPPIVHIAILNFGGYKHYDWLDLRGFHKMVNEMIIDKCALPNPPWNID
jgi:hypothetical protein